MSMIYNNSEAELKKLISTLNFFKKFNCGIEGEEAYDRTILDLQNFFCDVEKFEETLNQLDFTKEENRIIIEYFPYIFDGLEDDKIKFIELLENLKEKYPNNQEVQGLVEHAIRDCNTVKDDGWHPYY